ncbi:MAG: histidine kinase dimerization/phospho-acceptor domain-containing protein, partial [Cyanobacteriota bacterium]|nr:histidine kinase dimerization/phospho-acceptor domain-containing protein [Cyanobacteriota bacterium]
MSNEIYNGTLPCKVLDSVATGICLLRSDWVVLFWNRYIEQYTKISQAQIIGTDLFTHFHHLNSQKFKSYGNQVFQQKQEIHFSALFYPPGSYTCYPDAPSIPELNLNSVTLTPVLATPGEDCYALLTLHDCQPQVSPGNHTPSHVEENSTELEQLIYRLSHDLREPLRMVVSFCELLEQRYSSQLDSTGNRMIHFAVDGARRMQQMMDGLLMYSRLKSEEQQHQVIEAKVPLEQAIMDLQPIINKTAAQIQISPLPTIKGNPRQLTQLFSILIENAIKYCRDDPPKINIAAKSEAEVWVFTVQDNGMGIEAKDYQVIFEIFQRLQTRQESFGIG